jgi:hypothetical protein
MRTLSSHRVLTNRKTPSGSTVLRSPWSLLLLVGLASSPDSARAAVPVGKVPTALTFGMPVGGNLHSDLGPLSRGTCSSGYPRIRFNDDGNDGSARANEWAVATAFNEDHWSNLCSTPAWYNDNHDHHPGEDWNATLGSGAWPNGDARAPLYAIANGVVLFNSGECYANARDSSLDAPGCFVTDASGKRKQVPCKCDAAGFKGGWGNTLILLHRTAAGEYVTSFYGHLADPSSLPEGRFVTQGSVIGYLGSTGESTGYHLHFEVRKGTSKMVAVANGSVALAAGANRYWPKSSDPISENLYNPSDFLKKREVHPVAGRFDGGRVALNGTYRNGRWDLAGDVVPFGLTGDQPVVGDWNGDGVDDLGIFRPTETGTTFYLDRDRDGQHDYLVAFGNYPQDIPIAGDWDGDGDDDLGGFDPTTATFHLYLLSTTTGVATPYQSFTLGMPGDLPLVGNWDGTGGDEVGVFRSGTNEFFFDMGLTGGNAEYGLGHFGQAGGYGNKGDLPVVGDWDGDGDDNIGVYRPGVGFFPAPGLPNIATTGGTKAAITSPSPGSRLSSSSATFTWGGGTGVTAYFLYVGTTPGGADLHNSGQITATSRTVSGLPADGRTLHVRLSSLVNGRVELADYTYTAASAAKASLLTPSPGSTLGSTSVSFSWSAGALASGYKLQVGTTAGGTQIHNSGQITATARLVSRLPTDGRRVYVRLWSLLLGSWQYTDYTLTAATATKAALWSPTPGSPLSASSVTFSWTSGTAVSAYRLYVGTTVGGNQLHNSGQITVTSRTVSGLPTNGSTVRVRLYSLIGASWQYADYVYVAATASGGAPAALLSPAPGSTLPPAAATFTWSAGSGVSAYWLYVGSAAGDYDIYNSNQLLTTSRTVFGLPVDGRVLYVRLWSFVAGGWSHTDHTYRAAPVGAVMTSPSPGSFLYYSPVTFTWVGNGVAAYWLYVGTTPGGYDLLNTGELYSTSWTAGVPTNGNTVYVRLWFYVNGGWGHTDYSYP